MIPSAVLNVQHSAVLNLFPYKFYDGGKVLARKERGTDISNYGRQVNMNQFSYCTEPEINLMIRNQDQNEHVP